LVVGAAGDLGGATATALAADGWSLMLADHPGRADVLAAVADRLRTPGHEVVTATFDVTDTRSVGHGLAALVEGRQPPRAAVLGAGVQGPFRPVHDYDVEAARTVLEVNVLGTYAVVVELGRLLVAAGSPCSVVLMASMAGVSGAPNMSAYSASKAALLGLTRSAAKDLAPHGIRVNAVSPAFIGPGAMWDNQVVQQAAAGTRYFPSDPQEVARQMIGMVPLGRYGSPAEVADVVCWLAGPRSSYVTGQNIEISGGSV